MPGAKHEFLSDLFRNRPELAAELLRQALGIRVPAHTAARIVSANLTQVVSAEFHADQVVLLLARRRPVFAIVVEVQHGTRRRKRFAWPAYGAVTRSRFKCDVAVLVFTDDPKVARWAAKPIVLGPGFQMQPLVLETSSVPTISDVKHARKAPELAVLGAIKYAKANDRPKRAALVVYTALVGCLGLDDEKSLLYSEWIRSLLGPAVRAALEELMETRGQQFQSEFAKRHEARGEARALLTVLEGRRLAISKEQRERILGCSDRSALERWLRKAGTVSSIDELFARNGLRRGKRRTKARVSHARRAAR